MSDYSEAMKAALARVDQDVVFINAVTIDYKGLNQQIHCYNGGKPEGFIDDDLQVGYLNCLVEDGSLERFIEMPFEVIPPKETDKAVQKAKLRVFHLNGKIRQYAKAAIEDQTAVNLTFRSYIYGKHQEEISGVSYEFQLENAVLNSSFMSGELVLDAPNLFAEKFPREVWNNESHPWLVNRTKKFDG